MGQHRVRIPGRERPVSRNGSVMVVPAFAVGLILFTIHMFPLTSDEQFAAISCKLRQLGERFDRKSTPTPDQALSTTPIQHPLYENANESKSSSATIAEKASPVDISGDSKQKRQDQQVALILRLWETSARYNLIEINASDKPNLRGLDMSLLPRAPHLNDCKARSVINERLDKRSEDGRRPRWTLWRGRMQWAPEGQPEEIEDGEVLLENQERLILGPYPPWVEGADEDNLAMTRRVQRDLWLHQHPKDCTSPERRFLLTDWTNGDTLGLGAQLNWVSGMFAIALRENRILVLKSFNRANHTGCTGSGWSHWSCYFNPETSPQCEARALELEGQPDAWRRGSLANAITLETCWQDEWLTAAPRIWGEPWKQMHPTTEIRGNLLMKHEAADRRWWRAQAMRYLMRFPSEYLCTLLNRARHHAFGGQAAEIVFQNLPPDWPKTVTDSVDTVREGEMETFVWDSHKPWVPRPLVSIHVRIGDKGREMRLYPFKVYMQLAHRLRLRFPDAKHVWLSTEMQSVINATHAYKGWDFHYSKIRRQAGRTRMEDYERGLGRQASSNNAFVNLLMAADADFFIGALGSTWCTVVDGLRCTTGKEMAGFLSVNKDRFW